MYKKILLCYDGTVEGGRVLRQGAEVAASMKATVYLLAICRNMVARSAPEGVTPELMITEEHTAKQLLQEGIYRLKEVGLTAEGSLVYGDPMLRIPEAAQRIGADLVVVGYRYRGRFARWWSESEEATLLHKVHCSILVAMPTQ